MPHGRYTRVVNGDVDSRPGVDLQDPPERRDS